MMEGQKGLKMPAAIASQTPAPKRRNHRKARKPFDGRNALGRRVKALTAVFRARLGPDAANDLVMDAAIKRAAEVTTLAEHMRALMLRGVDVSPDDVTRLTRAADLMTRRLHLDRQNGNGGAA